MATAPIPQASSREQSLLAGVSQRVTTKLTSLVELRRRRWHGHNEGSRELHRRLRVGQWEDPPASNQAPSQAAVLFDIAYTTSMMHHADMLTAADSSLTGYATVAYFFTVVQLILHWWSVSLFLCKLDPGDLFNEFVLVLYMVLVVGQALLETLATSWDKRMSWQAWLNWGRCLGFQAQLREWPSTHGGMESLGAVVPRQRTRGLNVGRSLVAEA